MGHSAATRVGEIKRGRFRLITVVSASLIAIATVGFANQQHGDAAELRVSPRLSSRGAVPSAPRRPASQLAAAPVAASDPAGTPPAAASAAETPAANPDLQAACGIDINMILDESGSVSSYKADIQRAFRAFLAALKNTGSRMAVSEFSTVARLPLSGAAQRSYVVVTDATISSTFEPYIASGYSPSGSTNWEDGFRMGVYFQPRRSQTTPHLTVPG